MTYLSAMAALLVLSAWGQPAERTFQLTNVETTREVQEIATAVRIITAIDEISTDAGQRSVTLRGPKDQIALAQWLIGELDKPATDQSSKGVDVREYRMPGSNGDIVRLVYLGYTRTSQDLQEIVTVVRTTGGIRQAFTFEARRTLALRGSSDEVELAQWMIDELGKPAGARNHAVREYRAPGGGEEVAQISYLTRAETPQHLQELNTMLRAVAHARRVFIYSSRKALVMRGSEQEMALSRWLVDELDKPGAGASGAQQSKRPPASEYRIPGGSGEVVRLLYLAPTETVQDIQQFMTLVRQRTDIREIFGYSRRKAIAMRETADQVSLAESLIQPAAKP